MADETPSTTLGRNDPCHCGSGKKYKKCHADADEAKERAALEKQQQEAARTMAKTTEEKSAESNKPTPTKPTPTTSHGPTHQRNTMAVPKFNMPRRTGGG